MMDWQRRTEPCSESADTVVKLHNRIKVIKNIEALWCYEAMLDIFGMPKADYCS
jgi:hypothetical protein